MKKLAIFLLVAPAAFASNSALYSVFGEDQRIPMTMHTYPYSGVVKLENDSSHCTGSLIGRDVVLTNSHCVIDESGSRRSGLKVHVHGFNGYSPVVSIKYMELGTNDYKSNPSRDWAVLKLSEPVGDAVGTLDLANSAEIGPGYTLAGFSGDFHSGRTAGVHQGCELKGRIPSHGVVMHDCDMTHGSSGSAIWKMQGTRAVVHALNSAQRGERDERDYWSSDVSNLAVPVENFKAKAMSVIADSIEYETGLVLCNQKSKKVKFALGYWNNNFAKSKGWHSIAAGKCEEVKLPKDVREGSQSFKVYAYSENNEISGSLFRDFCIGGFFPFTKDQDDCTANREKAFSYIGELKNSKINKLDIQ